MLFWALILVWSEAKETGGCRYDRFSMDVTYALTKSRTGQHDLVIRVFDPSESAHIVLGKQRMHPDSTIFYKGVEGIWGSVWLEPVSVLCHFTLVNANERK